MTKSVTIFNSIYTHHGKQVKFILHSCKSMVFIPSKIKHDLEDIDEKELLRFDEREDETPAGHQLVF
jgi:hypothetical protein